MDENNQNIAVRIFNLCILICEIIISFIRIIFSIVVSLVQCVTPHGEKSVAGEIVLITGTGHGIGKELARQYGELGAVVICVDINRKTNQETVDELKKRGFAAHAFECDVSKWEEVLKLGQKVRAEIGDVTILVNNAGIMKCKKWEDHTIADVVKTFEVNVFAHFWLIKVFLPSMIEKNKGHVVSVASAAGLKAISYAASYCGSKFAVVGYMEAIAEELRQQNKKIHFTTVCPYFTNTGFCKSYKVRFPFLTPEQGPEYVAAKIISAQRRGRREVTVPSKDRYALKIIRLLPEKGQELIFNFLDVGIVVD